MYSRHREKRVVSIFEEGSLARRRHRLVLRGHGSKLCLHPLPTHIVGARRKDGGIVRSRVRIDSRRLLVHSVIVNRTAPAELDGIAGSSIRLLDAVAEETGTVGRLVARHLLRGKNYGCRRAFRVLVRVLRFLRELARGLNASSGIAAFNAKCTPIANTTTPPNALPTIMAIFSALVISTVLPRIFRTPLRAVKNQLN